MRLVSVRLVLGVCALILGIAEFVAPFGPIYLRRMPGLLVIIALVLLAREAIRRQAYTRERIVKAVPPRPLGLMDESSDLK
jgi:hypothetical protein